MGMGGVIEARRTHNTEVEVQILDHPHLFDQPGIPKNDHRDDLHIARDGVLPQGIAGSRA